MFSADDSAIRSGKENKSTGSKTAVTKQKPSSHRLFLATLPVIFVFPGGHEVIRNEELFSISEQIEKSDALARLDDLRISIDQEIKKITDRREKFKSVNANFDASKLIEQFDKEYQQCNIPKLGDQPLENKAKTYYFQLNNYLKSLQHQQAKVKNAFDHLKYLSSRELRLRFIPILKDEAFLRTVFAKNNTQSSKKDLKMDEKENVPPLSSNVPSSGSVVPANVLSESTVLNKPASTPISTVGGQQMRMK